MMDINFIDRPLDFPASLPTHRPLPVPSNGLHTPPFTPQSAPPLSDASFPSFFVRVRGKTAESTFGKDQQVSPVSAPGSFAFRTPFSYRRTTQSSQPSSIGDSVADGSYSSSHSAAASDSEDFEMDMHAVMLSDDSSQQQMLTGYGSVQANESAVRTESRSPPYPAQSDSPHKEVYPDQQPQQDHHRSFPTPTSTVGVTSHDSQRSIHHAGSFHPSLLPMQTTNEQYHALNSPYGHNHPLIGSLPSQDFPQSSAISQNTYIQMPPPPGLSGSLQSSISSMSSPISMGPWPEGPQIAPLNLPRNQAEMDSVTPRSSESFASQQAMWHPANTFYPQNPNYAPTAYMIQASGFRGIPPSQGLPSMQFQQFYHSQPIYGTWAAPPPPISGNIRNDRGPSSGIMIRPSAVIGAKPPIHSSHEDNPAVSSSVPAYVNAVAINVSPKVIEAFERHHDPNDPFAPQALTRPPLSYAALIGQAILAADPPNRLLISDIFSRVVDRYPFYAANPKLLYNGIRHAMTISEAFEKIPREWGDQSGKARKWGIKPGYESWFEGGGYAKGGLNAPKPTFANKKKASERLSKSRDEEHEDQSLMDYYEDQGDEESPEIRLAPARVISKRRLSIKSRQLTATAAKNTSTGESGRYGSRGSSRLKRNVTSPSILQATEKWILAEAAQAQEFTLQGDDSSPGHHFQSVSDGDIW